MTNHPWGAVLTRWGDPCFRLALLLTNDRTTAEHATIQAFTLSFATPSDDPEATLYAALSRTQLRRQHPFRRRVLPRPLERIAPLDRTLLGLWLLRDTDGTRLLAISGQPEEALIPRLVTAITPFLASDDPVHVDATAREAFELWLRWRLGLATNSPAHPAAYDAALHDDWRSAVDTLRHTLREAVGRQHLPQQCIETIEGNMLDPAGEEDSRWWRQRAAWIGALAIMLGLAWMIKPWEQGIQETAAAPLTTKQLVQETLDAWTTTPISGTLHRRVVAIDPRFQKTPLTTDLWLNAEGGKHRIEVRNGTTLVEWQIGDGKNRLDYAGDPVYASCDWAAETMALDRLARSFQASAEQQASTRDARLFRGAYGQGYRALQEALTASDLRSFGTRLEGTTQLLVLGYTDRRAVPERKLLLWIDPLTKELHAVREVAAAGGQTDTRDLWRLHVREDVSVGVSTVPPSWGRSSLARDSLLDPGCPGLDPAHVISLRTLINDGSWGWQQWYLPTTLPPDVTRAALLTPSAVTSDSLIQDARAVFIGRNRWLSLRAMPRESSRPNAIKRGNWRVSLEEQAGGLHGSACRYFADARSGFCVPAIAIEARGWTRDELLTLIDSFKLVTGQTWLEHKDLFLDPQPLSPESQAVLKEALTAIEQIKDQHVYSSIERTVRVNPNRPTWQDPYHLPLDLLFPERSVQEQWMTFVDNQTTRFRDITKHPDGSLIVAQVSNGREDLIYNLANGTVWRSEYPNMRSWIPTPQWAGEQFVHSLLSRSQDITVAQQDDTWLLEQPIASPIASNRVIGFDQTLMGLLGSTAWIEDLPQQRFVQRVWVDRGTSLPERAALVQIDAQGRETAMLAATITALREMDALPDDTFSRPALPDNTAVFEIQLSESTRLVEDSFVLTMPARTLIWPSESGALLEEDIQIEPFVFDKYEQAERVHQALFAPVESLDQTGLIRSSTYQYQLPTQKQTIAVRQGPRNLLQHILRHQTALSGGQMTWTMSKRLSATIVGQQRDVWLLQALGATAIVFEVDDLLVYISGPNPETLERDVLPLLSKLEWQDPPNES